MSHDFIKRDIIEELKKYLSYKEIQLITGPRQCGKTTVMTSLADYLREQGRSVLYLSLDIEKDKPHFTSAGSLLDKIRLEIGEKGYVFIDEIQRKENAGLFLKGLYDMDPPYKFIVSGSGNLELKEKIHESLAGRKLNFHMRTLNFKEFVHHKTDYKYEGKWEEFFTVNKEQAERLLKEYVAFGGYPRVVLETSREGKIRFLNEIYQSYLEKDISFWLKVEKTEEFSNLIKALSSQIGQTINYSELSNTINLSQEYVKKYLFYLEKTFIVSKVLPFFTNARKELSKSPIYYFQDTGMANYISGEFDIWNHKDRAGHTFENFVYNSLAERITYASDKLNFWRTKDGAEVDLVLRKGERIIPFEVKFKNIKKTVLGRSTHNFINAYSPSAVYIVNLFSDIKEEKKETKVNFLPFFKLFSLDLEEKR